VSENLHIAGFGPFAPLIALAISDRDCGFGPRGLYYNEVPTHTDADAFAIDFTHAVPGNPWTNSSNRVTVAVPEIGIVAGACGVQPTGSDTQNFVEILHDGLPGQVNRFLTRYLHMAGPGRLGVLTGALVVEGDTIGPVDSTGNSAMDHLHFSIHDQTRPFAGPPGRLPVPTGPCSGTLVRGSGTRPSPMAGHPLNDADEARCVQSRTTPGMVLYQGGPRAAPAVVVVRS
jgi:hypothetical protein